jgi:hypothetical protein
MEDAFMVQLILSYQTYPKHVNGCNRFLSFHYDILTYNSGKSRFGKDFGVIIHMNSVKLQKFISFGRGYFEGRRMLFKFPFGGGRGEVVGDKAKGERMKAVFIRVIRSIRLTPHAPRLTPSAVRRY